MPNVSSLLETGTWGPMRSTVPPITVPAWVSMTTGRDPGELGLYGFRNRERGSYDLKIPTSRDLRDKRLWDILGESGRKVAPLFVPLTWPPTAVNGCMVSCFMTPTNEPWAYPARRQEELTSHFGPYMPDVSDFRSDEKKRILKEIYAMGRQHFAMARHVWKKDAPDFLMMVEMGPDRFHHAFWHCIDPSHPRYEPGNPYEEEGAKYYRFLDEQIGALVAMADEETTVLIVSDHGARAMRGAVRINAWLEKQGWLVLKQRPSTPQALTKEMIDWPRTRAWGEGGYYARVFMNVEGRESSGVVSPRHLNDERDRLARSLEMIPDSDGAPLPVQVVRPDRSYRRTRGCPPDLMVFFDSLGVRSVGTVGAGPIYTEANDRGPDSCNHDWEGIFVMAGGGAPERGPITGLSIYDVTRTVLGLMGVPAPQDLLGTDWSMV